jgi:hypothetical protein
MWSGFHREAQYKVPAVGTLVDHVAGYVPGDQAIVVDDSSKIDIGDLVTLGTNYAYIVMDKDDLTNTIEIYKAGTYAGNPGLEFALADEALVLVHYKMIQGHIESIEWEDTKTKTEKRSLGKQDVLPEYMGTSKVESKKVTIKYRLGADIEYHGEVEGDDIFSQYSSLLGWAIGHQRDADFTIVDKRLNNQKLQAFTLFVRDTYSDEFYSGNLMFKGCVVENVKIELEEDEALATVDIKFAELEVLESPDVVNILGSSFNAEGALVATPDYWKGHYMLAQGNTTALISMAKKLTEPITSGAGAKDIKIDSTKYLRDGDLVTIINADDLTVFDADKDVFVVDATTIRVTDLVNSYSKWKSFVIFPGTKMKKIELNVKNTLKDIKELDNVEVVKEIVGTAQEVTVTVGKERVDMMYFEAQRSNPQTTSVYCQLGLNKDNAYTLKWELFFCTIKDHPKDSYKNEVDVYEESMEITAADVKYTVVSDVSDC